MIDYLTFIEELKKIRNTNNTRFADPSQTNKVIDKTVEKPGKYEVSSPKNILRNIY